MSTLIRVSTVFERILVPTDFTDASLRATIYAMAFAKRDKSKIMLAHVNPVVTTINPDANWITEQEVWRQAEATLEQKGAELRSLGFQAETISLTGPIEDELLSAADRKHADLIVMGTQADQGLERLLFGSDAEVLLRNAHCPILVIGPAVESPAAGEWHPTRILCPTNLDPASASSVAIAYRMAEQYRASFTLLYIESPTRKSTELRRTGFRDELANYLPDAGAVVRNLRIRLSDEPGYAIVDYAMENNIDLIAMGVSRAPVAVTHLLRGIAPQIIAKALCPVMVLH